MLTAILGNVKILKITTIVSTVIIFVLSTLLVSEKILTNSLQKDIVELNTDIGKKESRINELTGHIEIQNKSIKELGRLNEEYHTKLKRANEQNKASKAELDKRLKEIEGLKIPSTCEGKINTLKDELIKAAKPK
jgi:chromosome segregation ATPase